MATPDPSNVAPWYLRNINQALALDETSGNVYVRTGFEGNIIISGNVSIPGNVDAHISEIGTSGNLTVPWMPVSIDGNSNVTIAGGNVNAAVTGTVAVSGITGNIAGITGNVNIGTMPTVQANVTGGNVNAAVTGTVTANQGTNPWVVTGNVNANVTQGTNPWIVSGNVVVTNTADNPNYVQYAPGTQLDTNGRLRVSQAGTQWWYLSAVDKDGDLRYVEKFTGTGAETLFVQNLACTNMSSGTDSNGSAIRASRRRHKVRPGISHQYYAVWSWDGIQNNVTKRRGMFTNFNGLFYELTDDLYVVVRKRLMDGTLIETRVKRTSFNGDILNGTGPSGINITAVSPTVHITSVQSQSTVTINATTGNYVYDVVYNVTAGDETHLVPGQKVTITGVTPSTFNGVALVSTIDTVNHRITVTYTNNPGSYVSVSSATAIHTGYHDVYTFWFDFNGGRTDQIRFGISNGAEQTVIHTFDFLGTESVQYESAPALMERMEIFNTGAVAYRPSITGDGSAFSIEAQVDLNPGYAVAVNNTPITYTKTQNQEFPILGVSLRYGEPYQRADLQFNSLQMIDVNNVNPQNSGVIYWRLLLNPTMGGTVPSPTNIGKASQQWAYTAATTFTGGIELLSGYVTQSSVIALKADLGFLNMGSNIDYTSADQVVLVAKLLAGGSADTKLVATMNFLEDL
jgi:hypothetical protein